MPGSRNEGLSRPNWYCPREAQLVPGPRSCTPPSGRPEREVSCPALHGAGVPGSSTGGRGPRSRCSSGAGSRASPLGRDMSSPRRLLVNSCHGRSVSTAGSRLRSSCVGLAPPLRPMQFCIVEGHHVAGVPAGMTLIMQPAWARALESQQRPGRTGGAPRLSASLQPLEPMQWVAHARSQQRASALWSVRDVCRTVAVTGVRKDAGPRPGAEATWGNGRARVLRARITAGELAALSAAAGRRGLPVLTLAKGKMILRGRCRAPARSR
ncbi:hypothetical protein PRAC110570_12270 [Propionibacterium acidifaciens]